MSVKRERNHRRRVDTSKLILRCLLASLSLQLPFAVTIAILGNAEPFTRYIEGTFALTTIAVGFYYWKAKAENLHKYGENDKITMNGDKEI